MRQRAQEAVQALGVASVTAELEPTALERCLDGDFDWLLNDLPHNRFIQSRGSLHSQGFRSVRDILVVGAGRLSAYGEIGPKALDSISAQAEAVLPIPFKDAPTVEDMAAWCGSTDQIPVQVVMPFGGFNNNRYKYVRGRISIEEAAANTDLFRLLGGLGRSSELAKALIADFKRLKHEQ